MKMPGISPQKSGTGPERVQSANVVDLRLYIARSTPNSVRAESNLTAALEALRIKDIIFNIEVIDVFTNAKRAILDNVIVTPTLIVTNGDNRRTIVGDLSEAMQLHAMLTS